MFVPVEDRTNRGFFKGAYKGERAKGEEETRENKKRPGEFEVNLRKRITIL